MSELKAGSNTKNMRVYSNAFNNSKGVVKHDICRLASYARQRGEFLHGMGDFAAKIGYDLLGRCHHMLGFCAKKPKRWITSPTSTGEAPAMA